jgi:TonB family protein
MTKFRPRTSVPSIVIALTLSLPVWAQSPAAGSVDELSRGIGLYQAGDYKGAVEILKEAVKKQKENADAWYYLALAHLLKGDIGSSRKSFERAIKLRPDHSGYHSGLAYVLLILDELKNSEKEAEQAITIDSQNADAHYVLAKIYSLGRNWEPALRESEATLKLSPENAAALLVKTQSLVALFGSPPPNKKEKEETNARLPVQQITRERREKLERAHDALDHYLRLRPNDRDAEWWREQLKVMKVYVKRWKDKEDNEDGTIDYVIGKEESTKPSSTRPVLLNQVKGMYTQEALERGITGVVRLYVTIASDGLIKDMLVIEGLESGLSWKAIEAARKVRCKPATRNGLPVTVPGYLEFSFELR